MKQKTIKVILALIIIFTLIAAAAAVYFIYFCGASTSKINIYSEGRLVRSVDLSESKNYSFDIINSKGNKNTVTVKDGMISVSDADCPDKICVNTAGIKGDPHPIICVPNQLIISAEGAYSP